MREFKRFLQGRFPTATIRSRSEKRDPPDFRLWCDAEKYGVEVMRILHEENRTVAATQWNLVHEAERDARDAGMLSGKYVVVFHNRLTTRRHKAELKQRILHFVEQNANQVTASRHEVVLGGRLICDISKFDGRGAHIFPFGGGAETGGFEGDIREELGEILRRAIAIKAEKLAAIEGPVVLVLYDLYRLADRAEFRHCVHAVPEVQRFAYTYVIQDEGLGSAPYAQGSSGKKGT